MTHVVEPDTQTLTHAYTEEHTTEINLGVAEGGCPATSLSDVLSVTVLTEVTCLCISYNTGQKPVTSLSFLGKPGARAGAREQYGITVNLRMFIENHYKILKVYRPNKGVINYVLRCCKFQSKEQ